MNGQPVTDAGHALADFLGVPNHAAILAIEAEAATAAVAARDRELRAAGLDEDVLARALVLIATENDPLEPDEVIVAVSLEPDDPVLMASRIATAYRAALLETEPEP